VPVTVGARARGAVLASALLLLGPAALAEDAAGASDAGSLQQELAELERTRQEFDTLARQLDEQRAELERQHEAAKGRQHLIVAAVGMGVVALVAAGLSWSARARRRKARPGEPDG
jgi:septal ring factor EnvC (AmiA/AmiB activator)